MSTKYLIHADGKLPNLALMRLSTYFRSSGHDVRLVRGARPRSPGEPAGDAYGSSIFAFSDKLRHRIDAMWGPVKWGGTGVQLESSLAEIDASVDWEQVAPDYSIYPEETRSLGFTQRGCRLRCGFCVVPKKEGKARSVHTIGEIWRGHGHAKKIMLLDNDFFGQPEEEWRARVDELVDGKYRVCFSQGINIRLVDDVAAQAIARLEYRDNEFNRRILYTAWDNLNDERHFKRGVEALRAAGVPPRHLRVYMLVGYAKDETEEQIFHRFNEMVALGCQPYPMVFDQSRGDLKAFQRWVVTGLYRACSWADYDDKRKLGGIGGIGPLRRSLPVIDSSNGPLFAWRAP